MTYRALFGRGFSVALLLTSAAMTEGAVIWIVGRSRQGPLIVKVVNIPAWMWSDTWQWRRFETSVARLESDCNGEFAGEGLICLRTTGNKRHRLEHLAITDSPEAIVASAVEALEVVIDFIRLHLAVTDLGDVEEALLKKIRAKLGDLEAFVDARQRSLEAQLKAAYAVLPCPGCLQEALVVDDGVECLFCGYRKPSEEAADEYAAHLVGASRSRYEKDGGVWPVLFCPSCDWVTCVDADE